MVSMAQHPTNAADLDTTAPANFLARLTELPWVVPLVELHASNKKNSMIYRTGASLVSGSLWMLTSGLRVFPLDKPVSALDSAACKMLQSLVSRYPSLEQPPHVVIRRIRQSTEVRVYHFTSKAASFRISQALLRKAGDTVYSLEKLLRESTEVENLNDRTPTATTSDSAIQKLIDTARQAVRGVRRKASRVTDPLRDKTSRISRTFYDFQARNLKSMRRQIRTTRIAGLRHSALESKISRRRKLTPLKRLPASTHTFAARLMHFFLHPFDMSSSNSPHILEMEVPLETEISPIKDEKREKRKLVNSEDELEDDDESKWWEELDAEYESDLDPDYEPLATSLPTSEDTLSEDICEDIPPHSNLDTSVTTDEDIDDNVLDDEQQETKLSTEEPAKEFDSKPEESEPVTEEPAKEFDSQPEESEPVTEEPAKEFDSKPEESEPVTEDSIHRSQENDGCRDSRA